MTDDVQDQEEELSAEEQERRERAASQNLDPDTQVPETRPQAATSGGAPDGEVRKRLVDVGSPLAQLADGGMDQEAYDRATSDAQARKAAKQSLPPERLFPGAHCVIVNEDDDGSEHNGRSCSVNRVAEWESDEDRAKGTSGDAELMLYARVKTYEVSTRDGRAETLFVSAEHLNKVGAENYHKSTT